MLKIIETITAAVRPQFMSAVPALEQDAFLTEQPAAGSFVSPRQAILLDDFGTIGHNTVGVVLEAPSDFVMGDEVAVDWPGAGIIIHNIDTLRIVAAQVTVAA